MASASSSDGADAPVTAVVDCHAHVLRSMGYTSLEAWLAASPRHVYVGRQNRFVPGARQTEWGNPFSVGTHSRDESVARFEAHIRAQLAADPAMRQRLLALRG